MIQLTRIRHGEQFYMNPDLFERVDTHVDTVIRLIDGTEYVVCEPGDEIVRKIAEFRARIIAMAGVLQAGYQDGPFVRAGTDDPADSTTASSRELTAAHTLEDIA